MQNQNSLSKHARDYDAEYLFNDFWQKLIQWTAISSGKTIPTAFSISIGRIVDRLEMVEIRLLARYWNVAIDQYCIDNTTLIEQQQYLQSMRLFNQALTLLLWLELLF